MGGTTSDWRDVHPPSERISWRRAGGCRVGAEGSGVVRQSKSNMKTQQKAGTVGTTYGRDLRGEKQRFLLPYLLDNFLTLSVSTGVVVELFYRTLCRATSTGIGARRDSRGVSSYRPRRIASPIE